MLILVSVACACTPGHVPQQPSGSPDAGGSSADPGPASTPPPARDAGPTPPENPFRHLAPIKLAEGPVTSFDVAPDTRNVLFSSVLHWYDVCHSRYNGYAALSVGTTSGGNPVHLTVNAVKSSFSSTGAHLAFISAGGGEYWNACSGSGTLRFARGDGTHLVQVADFVADFVFGGETLYFYGVDVTLMSFFRFRESDSAPVLLSQATYPGWTRQSQSIPGYSMVPSPGGDAIAYCEPAADYVQPRCFLLPAGADPTAAILIEGAGPWPQFAWTPDGEWLVAGRIALSRDGKTKRDFGETCTTPSASPDGKAVMFGTGKQYACDGIVVIYPLDGSPVKRLGPLPRGGYDWSLRFIAGGTQVLGVETTAAGEALFTARTSGGAFAELRGRADTPGLAGFEAQPDGSVLRFDLSAPQLPENAQGSWPLLRLRPDEPAQTLFPSATSLPAHEAEGAHAMLVQEGWLPPYDGALHLMLPGAPWPGAILPGFVGIGAPSWYRGAQFNFGFIGRAAVYVTKLTYLVPDGVWDLSVATEDGSVIAPLASGLAKFGAIDHSLYFVKAEDRSLWRLDVPQP
jgi:hypothetical protein